MTVLDFAQVSNDSNRVVVLITDATYHKSTSVHPTVAAVRQAIEQAKIVPVFVVPELFQSTYNSLVDQLGSGAAANLTSGNLATSIQEAVARAGVGKELVAIVKNHSDLDKGASYFVYT